MLHFGHTEVVDNAHDADGDSLQRQVLQAVMACPCFESAVPLMLLPYVGRVSLIYARRHIEQYTPEGL